MKRAFPIKNDARRCHRQPVRPLAREDLCAGEERLRQPKAQRIVVGKRSERDHGQPALARLEAKIRTIKVKPERRVKPQWRVAGQDEQKLIERRDAYGQLQPMAQHASAIDDPSDALCGQAFRRRTWSTDLAHAINPGHSDGPKSFLGLV
jgi:hypothetical protein